MCNINTNGGCDLTKLQPPIGRIIRNRNLPKCEPKIVNLVENFDYDDFCIKSKMRRERFVNK